MLYQSVTKTYPHSAKLPGQSLPLMHFNLITGRYNLVYTPGILSSPWLTTTGKIGITFTLDVPVDHLYQFASSIPSLPAFLDKVQKGIACRLINSPATADLKMIRTIRNIMACPYTDYLRKVYFDLQLSNLLIMALVGINGQTPADKLTLKPLDVEKVEATRRYLMENMDRPPTLVRLARKMGLNDFKLKKAYKQLYGTTLFEDFLHARMDKARGLLEDTDQSIVGIAERVGYKNVSSFSVAFKKYFGYPPGEHRKRN